jgi:hypothetical protein
VLTAINHGEHRWHFELDDDTEDLSLTITYSNPLYGGLPNEVSFRFPVRQVSLPLFSGEETTYVCLHPDLAVTVQGGLYFEEGEVKGDGLYDWEVFWYPIRDELGKRARFTTPHDPESHDLATDHNQGLGDDDLCD